MTPTIINTCDSEGNAAQIHVASEAVVIHTAEGAAPTGISLGVTDASFLVLGAHADLTAERVLTAGSNISFTDTGAGGTLTINSTGAADGDAQILAWLGL